MTSMPYENLLFSFPSRCDSETTIWEWLLASISFRPSEVCDTKSLTSQELIASYLYTAEEINVLLLFNLYS